MAPDETQVGHCKADSTDVYIGRGPGGRDLTETPIGDRGWLGNPYSLDTHTREESLTLFREEFLRRLRVDPAFRTEIAGLAGQTLGCWCQRLDEDEPACHGEIIAREADRLATLLTDHPYGEDNR